MRRPEDRTPGTWRERVRPYGGLLLVVLALIIAATYVAQTHHERAIAQCQARVNNAFAKVLTLRGRLSDGDRAANRKLLEAITGAHTQAQVRRAEQVWITEQHKLDAQRDAHPFPALPARSCT